ncbi:MAG TPA: glycerol-3-phosphate 1-O-acyltransferase PlsY [Pyrinomonadaceae bacterium]|nr:glycerol-3-phosphate 1-O-acyltransferase PlsY [Pyrinomonadaceae bacterium]
MRPALLMILAYLIGSIPFGYLIVKATRGADIRQTGSGGTGATNVSRRAGKAAGILTLVLDALKGVAAVLIARMLLNDGPDTNHAWWSGAAALFVIVGHIFPIWLGFRGGKGVATGAGVFLMMAPLAVLGAGVVFLVVVLITRYVSLGSIVAAATIPMFAGLSGLSFPELTCAVAGALLIIFAHRTNIGRLIRGTESKFS